MELKQLLETKQVINGMNQLKDTLNKRGYNITFFNKEEKTGFYIDKITNL